MPDGVRDPVKALEIRRSKYGLGDRRSLRQAILFSGFALNNRTTLANRCGNLDFVPFVEHPLGPEYVPRFDEITLAPVDEIDKGSIYYDAEWAIALRHNETTLVLDRNERIRAVQSRFRKNELNEHIVEHHSKHPLSPSVDLNPIFKIVMLLLFFASPIIIGVCCFGRISLNTFLQYFLGGNGLNQKSV